MLARHGRGWLLAAAALILLLPATGCSRKPKPVATPTPAPRDTTQTQTTTPPVTQPPETTPRAELRDVYFDYDRFNIRGDQQTTLNGNGKALVDDAEIRVLLEGHCDERGTVEYNLALGERRAMAVKNYLMQYGVDAGRLSTISYGEERPFAEGHDEAAWQQNRRVHFNVR